MEKAFAGKPNTEVNILTASDADHDSIATVEVSGSNYTSYLKFYINPIAGAADVNKDGIVSVSEFNKILLSGAQLAAANTNLRATIGRGLKAPNPVGAQLNRAVKLDSTLSKYGTADDTLVAGKIVLLSKIVFGKITLGVNGAPAHLNSRSQLGIQVDISTTPPFTTIRGPFVDPAPGGNGYGSLVTFFF
jgi:hypothetical protein